CFESLLTFVRNEIAKPNLDPPPGYHEHGHGERGHGERAPASGASHGSADHAEHALAHAPAAPKSSLSEADKYVPYLWTIFLFVLFCNLLGMFPFMGSPTANIWVTGAMALISFVMIHGAAAVRVGPLKYLKSQWPHLEIDLPVVGWPMAL